MENSKDGRAKFNLVVSENFWSKLVKPFWLIAICTLVQAVLVVHLAFFQPQPRIDAKLLTVNNAMLDMEARILAVEQENALLFKMLRADSDQHGLAPEAETAPASIPLPPQPGRPIGDAAP